MAVQERGQASLEYMVMLALSLAVFSAILYVTSTLISTSSAQIGVDSAYRAVEKLRDSADFIYVHGHPSRTQVNIYLPTNVEEVSILNNNTFNIRIGIGPSYTDIYSIARGKVYGDLSTIVREGYYVFRVESSSDTEINITQL
jgi:uncharacterized protein (UPF0333 family)